MSDLADHPTERSALLPSRTAPVPAIHQPVYPPLEPVVLRVLAKGVTSCDSSDWCPQPLTPPAVQTAFTLVVLFKVKCCLLQRSKVSSDIWEQWTQEQKEAAASLELDKQIVSVWEEYICHDRTIQEIERVLWQEFLYIDQTTLCAKVVDFLCQEGAPQELLTHRLIYTSLQRTWKLGLNSDSESTRAGTIVSRMLRRFDSLCTPRVSHAVSLILQLAYLAVLTYFVLVPPSSTSTEQRPRPHWREALLMAYAKAKLLQGWSISSVAYVLVLLAFFSHLPSVPYPDDLAFGALLVALSWSILELHIPQSPSPLLLFPFSSALPLATLIWHGISRVFFPAVTFFLPALLLSLFLLSTSVSDIVSILTASLAPAPMPTRVAFLTLFSVLFLLLLCSVLMLVLVFPSVTADAPPFNSWDRYSKAVGIEARRRFIRIVVQHAAPYTFPAPFNILQLAAHVPAITMASAGYKDAANWLNHAQRWIWRLTIGPLAAIISTAWLWKLLIPSF